MTLLATKMKNRILKEGNYAVELKNIDINGRKVGCSGFISNPKNNTVVYINTEKSVFAPLAEFQRAVILSTFRTDRQPNWNKVYLLSIEGR